MKVHEALNEQIKNEFYAAYLYLGMVAYFDERHLEGFAHWMRMQNAEEIAHAMKLFDHLLDIGGDVVLQAIDQPPSDFKSPLDVMQRALAHEQHVTQKIYELYALSVEENNYATQVLLQWFVTEQVEEEKSVGDIVGRLQLAGDSPEALLFIDRELASRVPE